MGSPTVPVGLAWLPLKGRGICIKGGSLISFNTPHICHDCSCSFLLMGHTSLACTWLTSMSQSQLLRSPASWPSAGFGSCSTYGLLEGQFLCGRHHCGSLWYFAAITGRLEQQLCVVTIWWHLGQTVSVYFVGAEIACGVCSLAMDSTWLSGLVLGLSH